jgi:hypothetical protein
MMKSTINRTRLAAGIAAFGGHLSKISVSFGLAVALALASGCATNSSTGDQMKPMKGGEHQMMLPK